MKKIFSTYKYIESAKVVYLLFPKIIEDALVTWVPQCEGKTLEECNFLGYKIDNCWLVNENEYKPYQRSN